MSQRARVIIKHTKDLTMEKAYSVRNSVSQGLGLEDTEAMEKSYRVWKPNPDGIHAKMEDLFYRLLDMEAFYKKLCGFLGLKVMRKAMQFTGDGIPLTGAQLKLINKFIKEFLFVAPESIEAQAVRAFIVSRVVHQIPGVKKLDTKGLPQTIVEDAKQFNLTGPETMAIQYANQFAAEAITKVGEEARHRVVATLMQAKKRRLGPGQLSSDLWHQIADKDY